MAEIPIQPKRGGGIWPWVIGAIAILLLLWLLLGRSSDDAPTPPAQDTTRTTSISNLQRYSDVALVTPMYRRI